MTTMTTQRIETVIKRQKRVFAANLMLTVAIAVGMLGSIATLL
jgi:hypothetical protein